MSLTHFKVFSSRREFDGAMEATVTINRSNNLITIRPKRRRKTYEFVLDDEVARWIWRGAKAEAEAKRKAKIEARRMRRAA